MPHGRVGEIEVATCPGKRLCLAFGVILDGEVKSFQLFVNPLPLRHDLEHLGGQGGGGGGGGGGGMYV